MGSKKNFSGVFKGFLNTNSDDGQYIDENKLNQNSKDLEYYKMMEEQLDSFSGFNDASGLNQQNNNVGNPNNPNFPQGGPTPSDYKEQSYAQRSNQSRNFAQNNPPISGYENQTTNYTDDANAPSYYDKLNGAQVRQGNQNNEIYNDARIFSPNAQSQNTVGAKPMNQNNSQYIDSRNVTPNYQAQNTADVRQGNQNNNPYIDSRNVTPNYQSQNNNDAFDPRNAATENLNWNYARNTDDARRMDHFNEKDSYNRHRNMQNFGNPTHSNTNESREVTVISENTQIIGDIRSFATLNVDGEVSGNIQTTKDITIQGKVVGDISADDVIMIGSATQGRIVSKGTLTVSIDAIVLGDVKSQNINVDGKIKGNMQTNHKTVFGSNAVILGNVTSASIAIEEGANIQGYVSTTMPRDMNVKKDFPDSISLEGNEETQNTTQADSK